MEILLTQIHTHNIRYACCFRSQPSRGVSKRSDPFQHGPCSNYPYIYLRSKAAKIQDLPARRKGYNAIRPHSLLGYRPTAPETLMAACIFFSLIVSTQGHPNLREQYLSHIIFPTLGLPRNQTWFKFQTPNCKSQINPKSQFQMTQTPFFSLELGPLEFICYLVFVIRCFYCVITLLLSFAYNVFSKGPNILFARPRNAVDYSGHRVPIPFCSARS